MTIPTTPPDTEIDPRREPGSDLPHDPDETDLPGPPPMDPESPEPGLRAPGAEDGGFA
jgi:hypothetical protein